MYERGRKQRNYHKNKSSYEDHIQIPIKTDNFNLSLYNNTRIGREKHAKDHDNNAEYQGRRIVLDSPYYFMILYIQHITDQIWFT